MELLIKRDRVVLRPCEGRAEVDSSVPAKLRTPHIMSQWHVRKSPVFSLDERLIACEKNAAGMLPDFQTSSKRILPALWSGYRSALVQSNETLYRLKGVSFNLVHPEKWKENNGTIAVWGGQPRYSAQFEEEMSAKFNKIISDEGIEPVMECKGYWHYPVRAGRYGLSGSVIEVKGDTRLDELMYFIERKFAARTQNFTLNARGEQALRLIGQFYHDLGFIVGRMKKLMDENNFLWGTSETASNAHIGNVVLYADKNDIKIGFVDFDAACDQRDFRAKELRELQVSEHYNLLGSILLTPSSVRSGYATKLSERPCTYYLNYSLHDTLSNLCKEGLEKGYRSRPHKSIVNSISFERYLEIVKMLKSQTRLNTGYYDDSLGLNDRYDYS